MRSMSPRDMQISKPSKIFLAPPPPNPGDAPASSAIFTEHPMNVDGINTFTNDLSSFLVKLKNLKRSAYPFGDYNIDLLKVKMNKHYCNYFDDVVSNGFFPKITLLTR